MQTDSLARTAIRSLADMTGFLLLVLALSALATAQKESTIYSFKAGRDGATPEGGLISDTSGNLYGTTAQGGGSVNCGANGRKPLGCGTVFELSPQAGGHWTETILYAFQGGTADGIAPADKLVFDASGNLYGATLSGGAQNLGTIFELSPPAQKGGTWTETVLHSFGLDSGPRGLAFDAQGNLFGEANGDNTDGEIFEMSPPAVHGQPWSFNILYEFTGPNGSVPLGGFALDAGQNLYGATSLGGVDACGVVFELVRPSSPGGVWSESLLYQFTCGNGDGDQPSGGVIFHNGNLYGSTAYGGNGLGDGTVFELSPASGGAWTETTLYQFDRSNSGAFRPESGVVFDHQGNLYGTTNFSGDHGVAYKLAPPGVQGQPWTATTLHDFLCGNDGCAPLSGLIFDKGNVLYGTAGMGGIGKAGVVFGIIP